MRYRIPIHFRYSYEPASSLVSRWQPHRLPVKPRPLGGVVVQKPVSGAGEIELFDKSVTNASPTDWSRDGRYIFASVLDPKTNLDVWVLPQFGDRKAFRFLHSEFNEGWAKLSPNGQWLAYESDETWRIEIYVQTFPNPSGKWQISTNGGSRPVWSQSGKELYFIDRGRRMMAVDVGAGPKFQAGVPKLLFATRMVIGPNTIFDVGKDGRFLIPNQVEDAEAAPINVVVNWTAGLKK